MTIGHRNGNALTVRRVGVCVLCARTISLTDKWRRINRPATGKAHDDCISKDE